MLLLTANTCEANLPVELNTTKLPKQYSGIPTVRATTNTRQHLWHSMGQSPPPSPTVSLTVVDLAARGSMRLAYNFIFRTAIRHKTQRISVH